VARITADELHQMLETGESPVILDLRSHAELELDPTIIRGATHLVLEDIEKRHHEFPRDRDIIVYCSCPNEVTSARVALQLHRKGFTRVRPLLGGIDTWRNLNYPMETRNASAATVTVIANATSAAVDSAPGLILAVSKNGKGKSV
jgi:rhodanese-related sulfurtransferase